MIRPIIAEDIEAITDIYNYYISNTIISFEEETITEVTMAKRVEKVLSKYFPWLVAVENGTVIGYTYASQWNSRPAYKYSAEVTAYLSHTNTSKGWGTALYQALFLELQNLSIHTVIGGIALPNDASVALHEKMGMKKVAHFTNIGFKFNQWIDTGYWQGNLYSG